jgi:hypothetical protein
MTFSGSFLMLLEAQICCASKYFFLNCLGVRCYLLVGEFRTNKKNFCLCSVLAAWRVTPNTDLFFKKNPTSNIKTMYVVTDIGRRIIH